MTTVLAIDPGPERSAFVVFRDGRVSSSGIWPNEVVRRTLADRGWEDGAGISAVVIEKVESFGMAVGAEVFETVFWSGRFAEAASPLPVHRIGRKAIKRHLCGVDRARDANVRQALIDRYGGPSAIGRKATPGPLYGVSGDVWSALAVAVTWHDLNGGGA